MKQASKEEVKKSGVKPEGKLEKALVEVLGNLAEPEGPSITPSALYDPVAPKSSKGQVEFKSFHLKHEKVYDEQIRNKIFFIAQNSLQGASKEEAFGIRDGVSLKQQEKMADSKNGKKETSSKGGKPMAKSTLTKLQKLYDQ